MSARQGGFLLLTATATAPTATPVGAATAAANLRARPCCICSLLQPPLMVRPDIKSALTVAAFCGLIAAAVYPIVVVSWRVCCRQLSRRQQG